MQVLGSYRRQLISKNLVSTLSGELFAVLALFLNACSISSLPASSSDVYEGTTLDGAAPDFQLADQNGERFALSDFRGKVVVLTFLDSQCQDICPLTAVQLRQTHQALGDAADGVVFLGVNVNVNANRLEDVTAATQQWHLDEIAAWHFLTGNPAELETVWQSYGIEVMPPTDESADLSHSPGVYLIDQAGEQRWYVSTPFVEPGTPAPSRPLNELLILHIRQLLSEN